MKKIATIIVLLMLSACATQQQKDTQAFQHWLVAFKRDAVAQGIAPAVVESAFAGIDEPNEEVLRLDRTQLETTVSFADYQKKVMTPKKIAAAKEKWAENRELLKRVETEYGVPAPILLALWGIESNFGERQGSFSIVESLATLAYDGRRSQFFRTELMNTLTIIQAEHMEPDALTGSWAGAMGQTQFMPSSFLKFAVDFDHDGKRDIWNSNDDALASMANYLHQRGWNASYGWGMKVRLPEGGEWEDSKENKSLEEWLRLGVRRAGSPAIPQNSPPLHLVMPDDDPSDAFLVTSNYNVIMDWNHSTYFATTVGLLADAISRP